MSLRRIIIFLWLLTFVFCPALRLPAETRKPAKAPSRASRLINQSRAETAEAAEALFVRSDPDAALRASASALDLVRSSTNSDAVIQVRLDALFVRMEAAALIADTPAVIDTALQLCELRAADLDPRVEIAAARLLDLAANTGEFRAAAPRITSLLKAGSPHANYLRGALLAAAADGMSIANILDLSRQSGLVTNWRIAGPFGRYPNIAFDHPWAPERDGLTRATYDGRQVEEFQFDDGTVDLPDYFPVSGILYAAASLKIPFRGTWGIRVESPGTREVFVDGTPVVVKDSRFRSTPETQPARLVLSTGAHRVLVKFLADAAPFRVAVIPWPKPRAQRRWPLALAPEAAYVEAARDYWVGDYASAISKLTQLRAVRESASADLLLAQAWPRAGGNSSETVSLLRSALKLAPQASAAQNELAERTFGEGRFADAFDLARLVSIARPSFGPALELLADAASKLGLPAEAAQAYELATASHPSCPILQKASNFFASVSDFVRADDYQTRLDNCAPGSLAFAEALSTAGRHEEAASAAHNVSAAHPLDRVSPALLVRELTLAGHPEQALAAARQLSALAPNSAEFRRMADTLATGDPLLNGNAESDNSAVDRFYAPYRRNGPDLVRATASRHFSGGPAVTLLNDRVARIYGDGTSAVYVHTITRLLDRDGILQYGEVTVPDGADLLELRTIKADGTIAEPELNQHKTSISMPALAPGDVIEIEYVVRFTDGVAAHLDAFQFSFGSFSAPVLNSRFVVIAPRAAQPQIIAAGDVPSMTVQEQGESLARSWKGNDIPQSVSEIAMPPADVLPSIGVVPAFSSWNDVRDYYRNAIIYAAHIGSGVETFAASISGANDEHRLRAAFREITSRVRSSGSNYALGVFPSAETTLTTFSGSRTVALLAVGKVLGIDADLLMARGAGMEAPTAISPAAYNRPLLLFHLRQQSGFHDLVIDAETDGIGFGGLAPATDRKQALLVPLQSHDEASAFVPLPSPLLDDRSTADSDITFDKDGNLTAQITIRMGASRSAQLRSILGRIEPKGRKHFFEQLAMRIFPGATEASGEVQNETDPDNPLQLLIECRAPHYADFTRPTTDLDQLVPALGLRKMYAPGPSRRFPLFIDTPLVETSAFRVHLPTSVRVQSLARDFTETNEFGSYSVSFRQLPGNTVEVRREFAVPVQRVETNNFESFSGFARRIDDAERQRLTFSKAEDSWPATR